MIGASRNPMKFGNRYLHSLIQFQYPNKGKLYPINASGEEILGLQSLKSLENVPDPIDLAYITVPARKVMDEIKKCKQQNIDSIIISTAGFKEQDEQGAKLEQDIKDLIKGTGIRIIGPNCFGVYCPKGGVTLLPGAYFPQEPGPVGFLAQSGGTAVYFVEQAISHGLRFSKVISYGNAVDLSLVDFLDHLNEDEETKIIAAYVEGLTQTDRIKLKEILSRMRKPLIILKGGTTKDGSRAATSHTGFLASSAEIWQGFFKQYDLIGVSSLNEMVDTTIVMLRAPPPQGRNVGILGGGGAIGTELTDCCNQCGLRVPALSAQSENMIKQYLDDTGTASRNPIDLGNPMYLMIDSFSQILRILAEDENIHHIFIDYVTQYVMKDIFKQMSKVLQEFKKNYNTPVFVIMRQTLKIKSNLADEKKVRTVQEWYQNLQIPTFPSFERCVKAVNNYITYYERKNRRTGT